jgi:hypothetical protein
VSESPAEETRIVDPTTGGEKASKLARFDLVPAQPLWELAEHFGKGAKKYADRNWERGYKWSLSFTALLRHLWAWWMGEDFDNHKSSCDANCTTHTGSHHLTAVAWHAFALREFTLRHSDKDDRPRANK